MRLCGVNGRVMAAAGADGNWLTEDTATQVASAVGNPYLFTARRWDAATGLYYYRFRDYTPALGRFLQPDPLGYIDGLNLYAYVNNNPLNWIDPWGLEGKKCDERSLWEKLWDWFWGNAPEAVVEEAIEQVVQKLYVNDGDFSSAGESLQVAARMGLIEPDDVAKATRKVGKNTAEKAAKEARRKADNALKNKDFKDYFHNTYKSKQKISGEKGINNPDMSPEEVLEAYEEWERIGRPKR